MELTQKQKNLDEIINNAGSVAISGHVRPDGDCVGSCMAIYNYIDTYYPNVDVHVYLDPIPDIYKFMKNTKKIEQVDKENLPVFDLFIMCDCHDTGRLGDPAKIFKKANRSFCVYHHLGDDRIADDNYIFPLASSASELVGELIPEDRLTKEIAECIYTGIVTDTGVFQYQSTAPSTHRMVATLMETGIPFSRIVDETFFQKTYNQQRIFGYSLLKAKLHFEGRIISLFLTKAELDEYQVLPKHLEGIAAQLRETKGVDVALFLYQTDDEGGFKASTRASASCDINLAEICSRYGGGGHAKAAGFQIKMDPVEAVKKVVSVIEKELIKLG